MVSTKGQLGLFPGKLGKLGKLGPVGGAGKPAARRLMLMTLCAPSDLMSVLEVWMGHHSCRLDFSLPSAMKFATSPHLQLRLLSHLLCVLEMKSVQHAWWCSQQLWQMSGNVTWLLVIARIFNQYNMELEWESVNGNRALSRR